MGARSGPEALEGEGCRKVPECMERCLSRVVEVRIAGLGEKSKGLAALVGAQEPNWQSIWFPSILVSTLYATSDNLLVKRLVIRCSQTQVIIRRVGRQCRFARRPRTERASRVHHAQMALCQLCHRNMASNDAADYRVRASRGSTWRA